MIEYLKNDTQMEVSQIESTKEQISKTSILLIMPLINSVDIMIQEPITISSSDPQAMIITPSLSTVMITDCSH